MLKRIVKEKYIHPEEQYLQLIRDIIQDGSEFDGRNGNTICNIGNAMYFSLDNNCIPILTTKKVAVKTCMKELLWFIQGKTDNAILQDQNVHIWDLNAEKEFLERSGLSYAENDLGPIYGHQWRHFNATYKDCHTDYTNQGIDQLSQVIENLKNPETRYSRRHIVSAWNPCQIKEMALPPCHVMFQFHVTEGDKLSCTLYQRSCDIGLGVPFNIMSYSLLTHLIAHHCGLVAHEFVYFMGNSHIYKDHIEPLKEQVQRKPYEFPRVAINTKRDNIDDYVIEDFTILDYQYHKSIQMKMVQ